MLASTVYVIDNGAAGFDTNGRWREQVRSGNFGDNQLRSSLDTNNGNVNLARWYFSDIENGTYNIYATWGQNPNASDSARYVFKDDYRGNVLGRSIENQSLAPDDYVADGQNWEILGTVTVSNGTLLVALRDSDVNAFTLADAVRIELQDDDNGGGGGDNGGNTPTLTIGSISNQTTIEDELAPPVPFTVAATNLNLDNIQFTVTSSNSELIPQESILIQGSAGNYTITYLPTPDSSGTSNITVTAQIGTTVTSTSFTATVDPENDPPVASALVDVSLANFMNINSAQIDLATLFTDKEDATLTYTIESVEIINVFGPFTEVVTLALVDNILDINAITNVSGIVLVKIKGQDSGGLSAIQQIQIQSIQIQS